ncbi:MAG: hypothetical protein HYT12_02240 [Candidatus Liptonbacteria bacterium]|nr:hypothetical protein [Candidatus Liptonbacteria bacterium]
MDASELSRVAQVSEVYSEDHANEYLNAGWKLLDVRVVEEQYLEFHGGKYHEKRTPKVIYVLCQNKP